MEVMLQTGHQSHAYRLVTYHEKRDKLPYFPASGFGDKAEELGPRTNKGGPCLVLLRNVTVSPEEFMKWFQTSWLKTSKGVNRVYFFENGKTATSREDLLEKIKQEGAPEGRIRLQCNPRSMERWLAESLPDDFDLDPKNSAMVLNCVQAEGKFWYTMHTSDWLYLNSSNDPSRTSHTCSKAHNKLDEALYAAGKAAERRNEWCAVDLGAAPGSWTAKLASEVKLVIAVDPAELSDYAKDRSNVIHLKKKSEDCLSEIEELSKPTGGVDLLVCDMNTLPRSTAEILKDVLPLLKKGAMVVMTFKNRGVGRDRTDDLQTVMKVFGDSLTDYECIWLLANTVTERTLLAWRT